MKWNEAPALSADIGSVMSVESGGNDNAVSPKGAKGKMQVLDGTMTSPGYNVRPAQNDSKEERARVGEDYLTILQHKYGREGGLQAYNMGPGAYEKYRAGQRPLPAETAAYVPKVNSAGGGSPKWMSAPPAPEGGGYKPPGEEPPRVEVRGTSADEVPPPPPQNPAALPTPTGPEAPSKGFLQSATDTVLDAPTNFVAGAGKLMSIPVGAVEDVVTGNKLGTSHKERSDSIEAFRKEHTRGDSIGSSIVENTPEIILGSKIPGGSLVKAVGANAAYEGAKSGLQGKDAEGVLKDASMGGAGGAAGHTVARAVTGLKSGLSESVRKLADKGYVPTIGQMGGSLGKMYEKAASVIPGMPGAIERSSKDAGETLSRARANEALETIGQRTNKTGNAAAAELAEKGQQAYNDVLPRVEVDARYGRGALVKASRNLPRSTGQKSAIKATEEVDAVVSPYLGRGRGGKVSGEDFKKMDEGLGEIARKYEKGSVKEQKVGAAIREYQKRLRAVVVPKDPNDATALSDLRLADKSWREAVPVKDAIKRAKAAGGHFTGAQDAAATDRARQPRHQGVAELIDNPTPGKEAQSTGSVLARYGAGSLAGYGAHTAGLTGQFLAGVPSVAAGVGLAAGGYGVHQLINTRAGRTALLHGLAGVIPDSLLGKVSGLPPQEAARILSDWMAKPEVASVAAQVGRQLTNGGQDAP